MISMSIWLTRRSDVTYRRTDGRTTIPKSQSLYSKWKAPIRAFVTYGRLEWWVDTKLYQLYIRITSNIKSTASTILNLNTNRSHHANATRRPWKGVGSAHISATDITRYSLSLIRIHENCENCNIRDIDANSRQDQHKYWNSRHGLTLHGVMPTPESRYHELYRNQDSWRVSVTKADSKRCINTKLCRLLT